VRIKMGLSELLILCKQAATDKNTLPERMDTVCDTLIKSGSTYHSVWQCGIELYQRVTSETQCVYSIS
jgi:hypothetical protein